MRLKTGEPTEALPLEREERNVTSKMVTASFKACGRTIHPTTSLLHIFIIFGHFAHFWAASFLLFLAILAIVGRLFFLFSAILCPCKLKNWPNAVHGGSSQPRRLPPNPRKSADWSCQQCTTFLSHRTIVHSAGRHQACVIHQQILLPLVKQLKEPPH